MIKIFGVDAGKIVWEDPHGNVWTMSPNMLWDTHTHGGVFGHVRNAIAPMDSIRAIASQMVRLAIDVWRVQYAMVQKIGRMSTRTLRRDIGVKRIIRTSSWNVSLA